MGDLVIPFAAEILGIPIEKQICRVVQIRKEIGQFGSDLFFVRHADGDLFVWDYLTANEYLSNRITR